MSSSSSSVPRATFIPSIEAYVAQVASYEQTEVEVSTVAGVRRTYGMGRRPPSPSPYGACRDRLRVSQAFCGGRLEYTVLFNANHPEDPPDVVFDADEPEQVSQLAAEDVRSLREWDASDPRSLLMLVLELRFVYQQAQQMIIEQLQDSPRIQFEASTVLHSAGVECRLVGDEVRFVVPLDLSREVLAHVFEDVDVVVPNELFRLDATFKRGSDKAPSLKLVPSKTLGDVQVRLPKWEAGACLSVYIPAVAHAINDELARRMSLSDGRREMLECLAGELGSPQEYDAKQYRLISFLLFWGKKKEAVLARVAVPEAYPAAAPTVVLQSVDTMVAGHPMFQTISVQPYNPSWPQAQTANHIKTLLRQLVPPFLQYCRSKRTAAATAASQGAQSGESGQSESPSPSQSQASQPLSVQDS